MFRRLSSAAAVALAAVIAGAPAHQVMNAAVVPSPIVRILTPPDYWGAYAIWGATGTDARGHLWFGVTSNDEKTGSAHLYEFDPVTDAFADRGNVVAELERLRVRRPGERQMKIHSRIVIGPDQYQYFSSMDESGEADDGSKLPTWGGHLWRRGPTGVWEHLASTPEALIGVASGGPYVYALGYFDHVLYQFDPRTKQLRSVRAGAAGGHVSRNFFVDARGHAYVPRVTKGPSGPAAFLVEFDTALREVGAQPLREYFDRDPENSHGIVAVHPGPDGTWYFNTSKGRLYQVLPNATGPADVKDLGWFHRAGPRYVASMFRDEQTGMLYGVGYPNGDGGNRFEWIARQPGGGATAAVFPYGTAQEFPGATVLYGSMSRDAKGRMYVVGTMNFKPVILQVTLPAGSH